MRWKRRWELGDQETEDRPTHTQQFLWHFWTNLNYHIFKKVGYLPPPTYTPVAPPLVALNMFETDVQTVPFQHAGAGGGLGEL